MCGAAVGLGRWFEQLRESSVTLFIFQPCVRLPCEDLHDAPFGRLLRVQHQRRQGPAEGAAIVDRPDLRSLDGLSSSTGLPGNEVR